MSKTFRFCGRFARSHPRLWKHAAYHTQPAAPKGRSAAGETPERPFCSKRMGKVVKPWRITRKCTMSFSTPSLVRRQSRNGRTPALQPGYYGQRSKWRRNCTSRTRHNKRGGGTPLPHFLNYSAFRRPVSSLKALISSSSSLACAWTASQVPLVSYHWALRSSTDIPCCSTQV